MQVALVFPPDEVFALEVGGAKCGVTRLVVGIPGAAFVGGQNLGRRELQIDRGHRTGDRHVLVVLGLAAAGVVVEEGRRLGVAAVAVVAEVAQGGQPLAMGRLVLAHEQEGLGFVSVAKPVDARAR